MSLIVCMSVFSGCSAPEKSGKFRVVCSSFPQYDWVRNIIGDNPGDVSLSYITDNGVDMHNFQPTVKQIASISSCDMFIYIGGESEEWVGDVLATRSNKDMIIVNLMEELGDRVKEEEGEEEGEHEHEEDAHIWLSLSNADFLTGVISAKLCEMDGENTAVYSGNADAYHTKLMNMDEQYRLETGMASNKIVLFADRFPFRYLVDDYGIAYYAAFSGCSAESGASFATIVFLAGKVDEHGLKFVMTTESSDGSIARSVIANTSAKNQRILKLDSMQSVNASDVKNGATYLGIMENNLNVLKTALEVE